jgi:hypothetical protein
MPGKSTKSGISGTYYLCRIPLTISTKKDNQYLQR